MHNAKLEDRLAYLAMLPHSTWLKELQRGDLVAVLGEYENRETYGDVPPLPEVGVWITGTTDTQIIAGANIIDRDTGRVIEKDRNDPYMPGWIAGHTYLFISPWAGDHVEEIKMKTYRKRFEHFLAHYNLPSSDWEKIFDVLGWTLRSPFLPDEDLY